MAERIYITEDDDSIRELVTVALSAYSYEVESFVSAEDALPQPKSRCRIYSCST